MISFLSLISCHLQMWVCSTLVIPPLATGLPQLGHHDGPAAGMEVTRAFNLAVPSVLIAHWSISEGTLVSSPSGCLLDINCAGGGTVPTVVAGIWHSIHSSHWDQITGKKYPLLSHMCTYTLAMGLKSPTSNAINLPWTNLPIPSRLCAKVALFKLS